MSENATLLKGFKSIDNGNYDQATDALDKAGAILSTLSASYDEDVGFIAHDQVVWMTLLAATDLLDKARSSLAQPSAA